MNRFNLSLAAACCGSAAVLLVHAETGNLRLSLAALLASLMVCLLHHAGNFNGGGREP